jgi:beta-lactamase class A
LLKQKALVAGTMLGAAALVGGLSVQWGRWQPEFKLPAPSVYTLPTAAERLERQLAVETGQLQATADAAARPYSGRVSIVVTDLKSGASASVAARNQMVSASLYKLYVGWAIYQKIDEGKLTLASKTPRGLTVGQCMYVMITISDNDCGYTLGNMVGWANLDTKLAALGLTQTKINNYGKGVELVGDKLTSAADVALFIQQLYKGKLLSPQSTESYINLLKADELNTWLPSGLPAGTPIAHKTGALYDLVHDAGIVYGLNGDYLIVVMSRGWDNAGTQPPAVFADISRQLWNFFAI